MTPSTEWQETVPPGEADRFAGYARLLHDLQKAAAKGGKAARALHAKAQIGVRGELVVLPDLPAHARVGPFAAPRTFQAYVRFSNGAARRQKDRTGDVRGVAIKLLGVDGKKVIPGMEAARTQDFLLLHSPAGPFRDAAEFIGFVVAARNPALALPRVVGAFGFGRGLGLLKRVVSWVSPKVPSLATKSYYSGAAIRFGAYAVRYSLIAQAKDAPGAAPGGGPDYLGDELAARLAEGPVGYDFRVQFYCDPVRTPIEDHTSEWKEADAPAVTVARLTLPKQSVRSPEGKAIEERIEQLSFDPWHALEELRPLGNIMRARNHAYRLSTQERGAAPEPEGDTIP